MSRKSSVIVLAFIILAAFGAVILLSPAPQKANAELEAFARCLAKKGVTMYGAYWCPHCQAQKEDFGGAFQYVPYVECTEETQKCLAEKINGYPTWVFPNGVRLEGEKSLTDLAAASGCGLQ